jgi:hypothetical protein
VYIVSFSSASHYLPSGGCCIIYNQFAIVVETFEEISDNFIGTWLKTRIDKKKLKKFPAQICCYREISTKKNQHINTNEMRGERLKIRNGECN